MTVGKITVLTKITVHSYFSILNRFSTKTNDSRFWNPCFKINAIAFVIDAWWKQVNRYMSNCPAYLKTTLRTLTLTEEHNALKQLNHDVLLLCSVSVSHTEGIWWIRLCNSLYLESDCCVFRRVLTSQIRLPLSLSLSFPSVPPTSSFPFFPS